MESWKLLMGNRLLCLIIDNNLLLIMGAFLNGLIKSMKDPLMAEGMAMKEALSWLKDMSLDNVWVETDCQKL
ncbi:hypothetical protein OROMI_000415 [Orobanche minor]